MIEFLKALPLPELITFGFIVVYGVFQGVHNLCMRVYCFFTGKELQQALLGRVMDVLWCWTIFVFYVKEYL